jgi:hypothetical protein
MYELFGVGGLRLVVFGVELFLWVIGLLLATHEFEVAASDDE